jgi:hypothetical protein
VIPRTSRPRCVPREPSAADAGLPASSAKRWDRNTNRPKSSWVAEGEPDFGRRTGSLSEKREASHRVPPKCSGGAAARPRLILQASQSPCKSSSGRHLLYQDARPAGPAASGPSSTGTPHIGTEPGALNRSMMRLWCRARTRDSRSRRPSIRSPSRFGPSPTDGRAEWLSCSGLSTRTGRRPIRRRSPVPFPTGAGAMRSRGWQDTSRG